MPRDVIAGWLDFGAFLKLYFLRRYAAKLLYELRLHAVASGRSIAPSTPACSVC